MNNPVTLRNDRRRRRQASLVTLLVTLATLAGTAYLTGATDGLLELVQSYLASPDIADEGGRAVATL